MQHCIRTSRNPLATQWYAKQLQAAIARLEEMGAQNIDRPVPHAAQSPTPPAVRTTCDGQGDPQGKPTEAVEKESSALAIPEKKPQGAEGGPPKTAAKTREANEQQETTPVIPEEQQRRLDVNMEVEEQEETPPAAEEAEAAEG